MHRTTLVLVSSLVFAGFAASQPSLDPPAGPIEESGRFGTLIELSQETASGDADSVFKITEPGSYILTSNVVVPVGEIGIEIASDNVTLDLNGYTVAGEEPIVRGGGGQSGFGEVGVGTAPASEGDASYENLVVKNGFIQRVNTGVRLSTVFIMVPDIFTVAVDRAQLSDLAISTVNSGIIVSGGVVSGCRVEAVSVGIEARGSTVSDCEATTTLSGSAFNVQGGRVTDCIATVGEQAPFGTVAFDVDDSAVSGCTARLAGNASVGFRFGMGGSVTNCSALEISGGTGNSIGFNGDGVISECVARRVFIGFAMSEGVIKGCAAINCDNDTDFNGPVTSVNNGF